jgi:hypothetical protein
MKYKKLKLIISRNKIFFNFLFPAKESSDEPMLAISWQPYQPAGG